MRKYIWLVIVGTVLLGSCGILQPTIAGYPKGEDGKVYPFSALGIPKGHLPPPGECKIWFPGREPGQQPPPQSCASALMNAPLGSWVITHVSGKYKVNIFNRSKRNVVDEVRWYATN
jgi:hypothetical protein